MAASRRSALLFAFVVAVLALATTTLAVPFGPEQATERLSRRLASSEPDAALLQTAASRMDAVQQVLDTGKASLRGGAGAAGGSDASESGESDSGSPVPAGDVGALMQRLAKLEQKLADGQASIRHQHNVEQLAAEAERKQQELAEAQRRRDMLQQEQREGAAHVTNTIQQAHEALIESRRKDVEVLEQKKTHASNELKAVLAQLKVASLQLDKTKKRESDLAANVESMTKREAQLEERIKSLKGQRKEAKIRLNRANKVVETVEARKQSLDTAIEELKAEKGTLQGAVKSLTHVFEDLRRKPTTSSSTSLGSHKGGDDASGCYEALSRVNDQMQSVGGTLSQLSKLKSHLEDRVDNLHGMIATLTAKAESLDRDVAPGSTEATSANGVGVSSQEEGDGDEGEEEGGADEAANMDDEVESLTSTQESPAASDDAALQPLKAALERSQRALDLAAKTQDNTGTVTHVQPVQVHVQAPPPPVAAPPPVAVAPSPLPSPSPAPAKGAGDAGAGAGGCQCPFTLSCCSTRAALVPTITTVSQHEPLMVLTTKKSSKGGFH